VVRERHSLPGPPLVWWSLVRRVGAVAVTALIVVAYPAALEPVPEPFLQITTANRETGRVPINPDSPTRAEITVWNMYEAGLPSRARIAAIERTPATEGIVHLHLWNLTEPMEWSILESFPNLRFLVISGMTFERGLLFQQGAPVEGLTIEESVGLGEAPAFSLAGFPALREFACYLLDAEEIPLLEAIPSTLETVTFLLPYEVEMRSVPPAIRALQRVDSITRINVSPLNALPTVFRQVPTLHEDLGPFR
jgi:hypothetical protein